MTLLDFIPENDVERVIIGGKQGANSIAELMSMIVGSSLYVPSKCEVQRDGSGFEPVLLEKNREPLVAAFSSLSRADLCRNVASFVLQMNGREFFLRLPPDYGAIVNPGYTAQLVLPRTAVSELKTDLKRRDSQSPHR